MKQDMTAKREITEQEQQWVTIAAQYYSLPEIKSIVRVSDDNPLSGCGIFRIDCENQRFALKVFPRGWWADRLYRAHSTAEFLNQRGFPSPQPLRTNTNDRILFLGENPAICTTWLSGHPLWEPITEEWLPDKKCSSLLHPIMRQLAVFHTLMAEYDAQPTRIRGFPSVAWLSGLVEDARKTSTDADSALDRFLNFLSGLLANNDFPEQFSCQHILVDCHPGQFLFDGDTFSGMVDFDHVATAPCFRDLSKFLSTDNMTLSEAAGLISTYLATRTLPEEQRAHLPAGILRYIIRATVLKLQKALAEQSYGNSIKESFEENLQVFAQTLPALKTALETKEAPGIPEVLIID